MARRKPPDTLLLKWGRNIASRRQLLQPDGSRRLSKDDPVMKPVHLGLLLDPPVAQSTVHRWEHGEIEPRFHHKLQLARILEADPELLFPLVAA